MLDNNQPENIYDTLDTEGQQENLQVEEETLPIDDSELPHEIAECGSVDFVDSDYAKFKPLPSKDIATMKNEACQLSFEQRVVFDKIVKFCKDEVIAERMMILCLNHLLSLLMVVLALVKHT